MSTKLKATVETGSDVRGIYCHTIEAGTFVVYGQTIEECEEKKCLLMAAPKLLTALKTVQRERELEEQNQEDRLPEFSDFDAPLNKLIAIALDEAEPKE